MNDEKYMWFVRTRRSVLRREQEILKFNSPDETMFDKWVTDYSPTIHLLQETIEVEIVDKAVAT